MSRAGRRQSAHLICTERKRRTAVHVVLSLDFFLLSVVAAFGRLCFSKFCLASRGQCCFHVKELFLCFLLFCCASFESCRWKQQAHQNQPEKNDVHVGVKRKKTTCSLSQTERQTDPKIVIDFLIHTYSMTV